MGIRPEIKPLHSFIWLAVVTVSILIHELGHAVAIRYYGYRPWITLYGLGGLASYNPDEEFGYDPVFVLGEHLRRYRNTRRDVADRARGTSGRVSVCRIDRRGNVARRGEGHV